MLPLYGIGRTFSTHDGFVKIGCWRWHKKKPPEGAQSADKVRGAGAFPVAQSFALPCLSQISAFCALVARSPCICSHLRVALRFAQQPTGLTLPSGALRVALGLRPKCPQGTRFPSRLPGLGAEPQSLMPQHFPRALRASEGRKKRGFFQIQGFFNDLSPLRGHGTFGKVMISEGTDPILHSFASKTECRTSETPRCKQPGSADTRLSQTG